MGRVGLQPEEVIPFMERAARRERIRFGGVCSHFATADGDRAFAERQLAAFLDVVGRLQERGFELGLRHMANSAAVLSLPESHLDMVRPGIMLYGLRPAPELGEGLKPVMTVVSRITKLKVVPDGTPVSYGSTYRSRGRRSIATIPMGYADGYRRGLSNRFHVIVRGKKAPVAGTVCMDMFMADVSDIEGVAKGDEVLIFGKRGDDLLPAEEMAEALGTINYEIVTGISPRVPRLYR
jgi:alanine racemase